MTTVKARCGALGILLVLALLLSVDAVAGQGRPDRNRDRTQGEVSVDVTFSVGDREAIVEFYDSRRTSTSNVEALPPGIRRNLARGKPLPPGIAKKQPPPALVSELSVPEGYEVVEVGWDVLLVEAATGIIHDVLRDAID